MKKLYVVLLALATLVSACQLGGAGQAEPTAIPLVATAVASPTPVPLNPTAEPQGAPDAGTEKVSSVDGMTQVYVSEGTFMRGGIDADAHTNEMPSAKVTMTGYLDGQGGSHQWHVYAVRDSRRLRFAALWSADLDEIEDSRKLSSATRSMPITRWFI